MKKKRIMVSTIILATVILLSISSYALAGGIPALHGITGAEFGRAVSELAKSYPGAVAEHIGGARRP